MGIRKCSWDVLVDRYEKVIGIVLLLFKKLLVIARVLESTKIGVASDGKEMLVALLFHLQTLVDFD
jgi:hypothetical protein